MVILGALCLWPLTVRLPMAGFDWHFFFRPSGNDLGFNIWSPTSPYPPFTAYILWPLTIIEPWRAGLGLLNALTLMTVVMGTWTAGGRWESIVLACLSLPLFFSWWIGHPDALALLGVLTGLVPLALIKPQLTIWPMLAERRKLISVGAWLALSVIIWGLWFTRFGQMVSTARPTNLGWRTLGWPLILVGLALAAGAGKNPYHWLAAGVFLTPYTQSYQWVVLIPALGAAVGWRKVALWAASWILFVGVGLGGRWQYLNLIYPLAVFGITITVAEYKANVRMRYESLVSFVYRLLRLPHYCQHLGCNRTGEPCFITNISDLGVDPDQPYEWYCLTHRFEHGYCSAYGQFNAGVGNFDFGYGYCESCEGEAIEEYRDEHEQRYGDDFDDYGMGNF
jgi:hypothetical protein